MASLQTLLFLCIIVTVSRAGRLEKRIYGGRNCSDTERLYHVRIRGHNGTYGELCGGSLISDSWVLTAAHCWKPTYMNKMDVIVGVHPRSAKKEMLTIDIKKIFIFQDPPQKNHDIMLLKLPKSITNIQPIALPDCSNQPKITDLVHVAGYGNCQLDATNYEVDSDPGRLQCATMEVQNCTTKPKCRKNEPLENLLCAKRTTPPQGESCSGDSGGGVVFKDKIYAVVSAGSICHNDSFRSVFLKVCPYMTWITNTMTNHP